MFAVEIGVTYEDIALQKGGPVPLYRQIAAAIRQAITQGSLAPGERLPPIRTLALMLSVSQVTTSQAYDQLIAEGAIASHVGRGSFVLSRAADSSPTTPQAASPLSAPMLRLPNSEPGHWLCMLPHLPPPFEALGRFRHGRSAPSGGGSRRAYPHVARGAGFRVISRSPMEPVDARGQSFICAGRSALLQYGSALGDETLRALLPACYADTRFTSMRMRFC